MEKICFELENVEVMMLDKEIIKIDYLAIHQLDRIGIVGKNGAGKSSLFKLLANELKPTKGKVNRNVDAGYFAQMEAPFVQTEIDLKLQSVLQVPRNHAKLKYAEPYDKALRRSFFLVELLVIF